MFDPFICGKKTWAPDGKEKRVWEMFQFHEDIRQIRVLA